MPAPMPDALILFICESLKRPLGDDLGVLDADQNLLQALPDIWALYADKGLLSLRLQYLYTLRDGIDFFRRRLFDATTFTEGTVTQADSDVFKALDSMRASATADIAALEMTIRAGQVPQGGLMTATRPGPFFPTFYPDPTDPRFRGLPFDPRIFYETPVSGGQ